MAMVQRYKYDAAVVRVCYNGEATEIHHCSQIINIKKV
jgi:hypothetical protein